MSYKFHYSCPLKGVNIVLQAQVKQ